MAINVGRAPGDRRLIDGLSAPSARVFPSVYVMDIPNTFNSIIYATNQPTQISDLYQNYLDLQTRDDVNPLLMPLWSAQSLTSKPRPRMAGYLPMIMPPSNGSPITWC